MSIIKQEDVEIIRNSGIGKTYWTVEIHTRFTKKEAEKFYNDLSFYHIRKTKDRNSSP